MKTTRVRIAVAVDEGAWRAAGSSSWKDPLAAQEVQACFHPNRNPRIVFVEADVPLPEYTTIEGEVRDA